MLVLVTSISKTLGQLSFVLSALLVFGSCQNANAQDGQSQKSILVSSGQTNPALSGGANGPANIDDSFTSKSFMGKATFTARPQERQPSAASMKFTDGPKPPSQMLTPEGPTEDTFTQPKLPIFTNDLRGGSSSNSGTETTTQNTSDRSGARGTHATTQQAWQDQSLAPPPTSQFEVPKIEKFSPPSQADSNSMMTNQSSRSNRSSFGDGSQPSQFSNLGSSNSGNPNSGHRRVQNSMVPIQPMRSPTSIMDNSSNGSVRLANGNARNTLGGIQPTGFAQPVPKKKLTTTLAKQLISRYSVDNAAGALPGEPVKLVDLFRQPIDSSKRQPMVHHYWEAYYDWATYVNAQQHSQWLEQLPNVTDHSERGLIEAEKLVAKNRVLASEIQLGKSQSRLLQYLPNRNSQSLPLPEDTPLIQKYKTNYEAYKSNRMLPESLRGIDQMLPKTLRLIAMRADAVEVTMSAAKQSASGMQTRQSNLATTLAAGRLWRLAEQDLIASVTNYNQAIADYALNVAQGNYPAEKMAEMLLGKPKMQNLQAAIRPSGTRQVNSQQQPPQQQPRVANAASGFDFNQRNGGSVQGSNPNSLYKQPAKSGAQNNGNFGPAALPKSPTNFGRPPVGANGFGAPATAAPMTAPVTGSQGNQSSFGSPSNFNGANSGKTGFGPLPGSGR